MSVLDMPNRLYMITDSVITAIYGNPWAKYSVGTHAQGERDERAFVLIALSIVNID